MALDAARRDEDIEVVGLLTTMNASADRLRCTRFDGRWSGPSERLRLPLHVIDIPEHCCQRGLRRENDEAIDVAVGDERR